MQEPIQRHEVYRIFHKFLSGAGGQVVHIAGENNTGKTSLAREFVLSSLALYPQNYYWVETENKLDAAPFRNPAFTNEGQAFFFPLRTTREFIALLEKVRKGVTRVKTGDVIVVDSLSNLLKTGVAHTDNYSAWITEVTHFFRDVKGRLAHLRISRGIHFILIHHMSYNPTVDRVLPYFDDHMRQIEGLWTCLYPNYSLTEEDPRRENIISLELNYSVKKPAIDAQGRPIYHIKHFHRRYSYSLADGTIQFML